MKIPAIKGNIGDWTYYTCNLTFGQISTHVSRIKNEIYDSESLKSLLQRSITDNYKEIKKYILRQDEMFFNSLVLAVYDDYPNWIEIDLSYEDQDFFQLGLLEFPGDHIIIPVDGQHRVEGIKSALKENPELSHNKVSCIFIAHKATKEGKKRTRRLFTTLNRYAKPVSTKDIIALDEDDTVAITTRRLLEDIDHPLLRGDRIVYSKQKGIPKSNKKSFTSIITFYKCNIEIFKVFHKANNLKPKSYKDYLRFRPDNKVIQNFTEYCQNYWDLLLDNMDFLNDYANSSNDKPAEQFRNNISGGNLLFRPVGLEPFTQAVMTIKKETNFGLEEIIQNISKLDFRINKKPWKSVVWNDIENKMIMGSKTLVKDLLIYMFGPDVLPDKKIRSLKEKYASKLNKEDEIESVLEDVPTL